jgi:hypothetical protein
MAERTGYFWLHRRDLEFIRGRCGAASRRGRKPAVTAAVAVDVFIDIVMNARLEADTVQCEGGEVFVPRGAALFSKDTFAQRLGRSPSSVYRAMKKLESIGMLEIVNSKLSRKHGRGRLPTVVRVTAFERYVSSEQRAKQHFETWSDTKEQSKKEEASTRGEFSLGKGTSSEAEDGEDGCGDAERVLMYFTRWVGLTKSRSAALAEIQHLLRAGRTAEQLIDAADWFRERCESQGINHRVTAAELFFLDGCVSRYLASTCAPRACDGTR